MTFLAPVSSPRGGPGASLCVVILCDHGWVSGGQAKIAIDSALQLASRGAEVCFVAGCGPLDERLPAAGIECHVVGDYDLLSDPNRLRAAGKGIWNRAAAKVVERCLAGRDPRSTVIHVHGWAKVLSPSIGPVVTRSPLAHVYTLHEYFLACPNGGFFDYRAGQVCTRRALGADCLRTPCDPRSSAQKAWRVARQVVLRSLGRMPRDLREIIYLAPEQIAIMKPYMSADVRWHYLANPVGPLPPARVPAESNDLVLFVGRLSREKGAPIAAAAAKAAGVQIVFCGDGECKDDILKANPDAILAGWVGQEEIAQWMRKARCLLFPSLWYEGYPLVVADALRAGLPVLVSDSSVAASSVANGVTGLHVASGDIAAWTAALERMKNADTAQAYSANAFRAGRQLLGEAEYTDRLIDIYRATIARKTGAEQPLEVVAQ
jgi:glycosyltransferase involved in cell wall biosynthesis